MEDPLPHPPPGGYYVVEVTGGFVNNTIDDNTIDLTGKSSTGIVLRRRGLRDRHHRQPFHRRHDLRRWLHRHGDRAGGHRSARPGAAASQFPLPPGWTALPDLGTLIDGNTIQDSLGGILIGVEHSRQLLGGAGHRAPRRPGASSSRRR